MFSLGEISFRVFFEVWFVSLCLFVGKGLVGILCVSVLVLITLVLCLCLQCFDTVGWASGRAFGL